jgi:hypothetical protein
MERGKFEFGVREWMVKTLSPFHAVTRGREIHVQRRRNDAGRRETKKPTDGELLSIFN